MTPQRLKKKLTAVTLSVIALGGPAVVARQVNPGYWQYERAVASTQEQQPLQPRSGQVA